MYNKEEFDSEYKILNSDQKNKYATLLKVEHKKTGEIFLCKQFTVAQHKVAKSILEDVKNKKLTNSSFKESKN
jgi:hypothetical protein